MRLAPKEYAVYTTLANHPKGVNFNSLSDDVSNELESTYARVLKKKGRNTDASNGVRKLKGNALLVLVNSINEKVDKALEQALLKSPYYHIENAKGTLYIPYIRKGESLTLKIQY